MNDLSTAVVLGSLQATLFCFAAMLIYGLVRRFGPRVGAATSLLTLLMLAALAVMSLSPWPRWNFHFQAGSDTRTEVVAGATLPAEASSDAAYRPENVPALERPGETSSSLVFWQTLQRQLTLAQHGPAQATHRWMAWIGPVFLIGMTLAVAWRTLGLLAVRRHLALSTEVVESSIGELLDVLQAELRIPQPIQLRETPELSTAAAIGWRRPVVLLPGEWRAWSDEEKRTVLAHELSHIARRDYVIWIVAQVGVLLHFYHPLAHWFARRLRLEQELAADALAAELVGGRETYLHTLGKLALRAPGDSLVWPVQAFLPARSTFIRRIEVLRHPKSLSEGRWAAAGGPVSLVVLAMVGLLVCGIRVAPLPKAVAQQPPGPVLLGREIVSLDPRCLPEQVGALLQIQPGPLLADPEIRSRLADVATMLEASTSLKLDDVASAWVILCDGGRNFFNVVRTRESHGMFSGTRELKPSTEKRPAVVTWDDNTLIFEAGQQGSLTEYFHDLAKPRKNPEWWARWSRLPPRTVRAYMDVGALGLPEQALSKPPMAAFAPLFEEAEEILVGLDLTGKARLGGQVKAISPAAAERVRRTLDATLGLGRNMLDQKARTVGQIPDAKMRETVQSAVEVLDQLLASADLRVRGEHVELRATADQGQGVVLGLAAALPAVNAARVAARRTQSMNNIRQILLGILQYESEHGHFPPAAGRVDGSRHAHSWRVAILPYLGREDLYKRYRFDEPWDSEANKALIAAIPSFYKSPSDGSSSGYTSYFAPVGEDTIIGKDKGAELGAISDGTANTIMVVEVKREVPWTKPEDLPADLDPAKLAGWNEAVFLVGHADGHVTSVSYGIDEATLHQMINMRDVR